CNGRARLPATQAAPFAGVAPACLSEAAKGGTLSAGRSLYPRVAPYSRDHRFVLQLWSIKLASYGPRVKNRQRRRGALACGTRGVAGGKSARREQNGASCGKNVAQL